MAPPRKRANSARAPDTAAKRGRTETPTSAKILTRRFTSSRFKFRSLELYGPLWSNFQTRPGDLDCIDLEEDHDIKPDPSLLNQDTSPLSQEDNVVDLTKRDLPALYEHYFTQDFDIVGLNHYDGHAEPGDVVVVKREKDNQFDSNAIRILDSQRRQIGHMPRYIASVLAPLLDECLISVDAMVIGQANAHICPARFTIFGPSELASRLAIQARLAKNRIFYPGRPAPVSNRAGANFKRLTGGIRSQLAGRKEKRTEAGDEPGVWDIFKRTKPVMVERPEDAIKTLAMSESALQKMPEASQPDALQTQLLPYQLQGLAWMASKESPELPKPDSSVSIQLWRRGSQERLFINQATGDSMREPGLVSGGILADDMGLGKTIQTIGLIISDHSSGPTLIVAPVTVMSNWDQQIKRHVRQASMPSVLIYHGAGRKTASPLDQYGVVITSYATLAQEARLTAKDQVLMAVDWRRVVLDEGHTIRNSRTVSAEACCRLKAVSRWVLTGTPIINDLPDFQTLLAFLHITGGLERPDIFAIHISQPLKQGGDRSLRAEKLLQALVQDLCLRRTKNMKFINLKIPQKTEHIHRIAFKPHERLKYDGLLAEAKGLLSAFQSKPRPHWDQGGMADEGPGQAPHFNGVLERLLRLRQMCDHWTLCKGRVADVLGNLEDQPIVPLNDKTRAMLRQALQTHIDTQDDCPICTDTMRDPVIAHCRHAFCRRCIVKAIGLQKVCPICQSELPDEKALVDPSPEGGIKENDDDDDEEEDDGGVKAGLDPAAPSSKTEALIDIIRAALRDPESKVVVFSQWTSFLNIIEIHLAEARFGYTRIDGGMRLEKRDAAIEALESDPNTRVLLASLSVCSVGLNLVAANTVILADSWWAPAIEDQAIDRVHRLGQTRETVVWRLVMEQSVEERVLVVQKKKRRLVRRAFQDQAKGIRPTRETRMADLVDLLA